MRKLKYRPRGWARHLAGTMSPMAVEASRVALERDGGQRAKRLAAATLDRARERVRPTRARMRALSVAPGAKVSWRDVPAPPKPGPRAAVVHPIAIATCDLDRALGLGATPFVLPLHFGHEGVAEVVAVGERVSTVRPGDRVVVPFQISCGECVSCRAGLTSNCLSVPPISMYGFGLGGGHWGGFVSDLVSVPFADAMLVPLPEGIDPAAAASVSDNVSDGYRHIGPHLPGLLDRDPDSDVVIVAAMRRRSQFTPSVPLYAGLTARALGARRVYLVDARPEVRAHAERLGLTALPPSEIGALSPSPLAVDASGTTPGLNAALRLTAPDGICSSVGALHVKASIPIGLMYGRNVTFHVGRTQARAVIPKVLELMRTGRLQPELVTTQIAPIDDAPRALRAHFAGAATKTILTAA